LVIVRDPDGETDATMFVDGVEVDDCHEYVIDAGRGYPYGTNLSVATATN
jgi:hypothetical protein